MRREIIILVVLALSNLVAQSAVGQREPVSDELANMVEQVVASTGISINIAAQTRTSVEVDTVNGISVCDPSAANDVLKLQQAFDSHPNIYRNIGPAIVTITEADGTKKRSSIEELRGNGVVEGCPNIYVSVRA